MINRIILITTTGCEGCRIARGILRAQIDNRILQEYDINDLPNDIHDRVVLHDFPTTLFVDWSPEYFEIKQVLVGTFSKKKLSQTIDSIK